MDLLAGKMLGFILVLTRVGAFFSVSPVFSWQAIPMKVKMSMAILTSIFFSSITSSTLNSENLDIIEVTLMIANEAIYGLSLGLIASMLFSVVKLAARIVERQMGLSMAQVLDPLSGESGQPLGMIMEIIFVLLFLSANGHHMLLLTISKSYDVFAIGSIPTIEVLLDGVIAAGSTMLVLGLKMSAPIFGAFLLMMVVLAIMARAAPEANILFLSLPLRVGLGLLMVAVFLPFISNFVAELTKFMDKLLPI
ncbi:MAG TPA: type III secretion protein [Phycisphaerales bacterium]|nr:type III secretion protein [Phycisphaerales bacterium]